MSLAASRRLQCLNAVSSSGRRQTKVLQKPKARRCSHIVRADSFDEGAAQVRRLLDRDRKDIDFDELEKTFDSATDGEFKDQDRGVVEATPSNSGAMFAADKTKMSPFGPSPGSLGAVPFEGTTRKPSIEPKNLSPDMKPAPIESTPWWTKITLTQVVIVLSFTTIISLMIATFFFVLNVGAIRLNE